MKRENARCWPTGTDSACRAVLPKRLHKHTLFRRNISSVPGVYRYSRAIRHASRRGATRRAASLSLYRGIVRGQGISRQGATENCFIYFYNVLRADRRNAHRGNARNEAVKNDLRTGRTTLCNKATCVSSKPIKFTVYCANKTVQFWD